MNKRAIIFVVCLLFNKLSIAGNTNQTYFNQFQEVFTRIEQNYVDEPDKQKITDAAINGMLTFLDPYSSYFVDEDYNDLKTYIKGEFGGLGIEIIFDNGAMAIKIVSPIDGSPADKAGIKAGDYIVGVNDELVSTLGYNKAVKEMRGEPGTKVRVLVAKEDETKPREIELTREIVKLKTVKSSLDNDNIAYIRIVTFNEQTYDELKKHYKDLQTKAKDDIKGIILDVRNNPGGILEQAVAVTGMFVESGVVLTTKGRDAKEDKSYHIDKSAIKVPNVPMIVMINAGSASASEIVAGALQDYKRALLLGTKSFGKGSVQTFAKINSRNTAATKMTTAKYYTPSGRSIQGEGIEPDIAIEQIKIETADKKSTDERFSEDTLKKYLKNSSNKEKTKKDKISNSDKDTDKDNKDATQKKETTPVAIKDKKEDKKEPSDLYKKDYQYARAYDLMRGLVISKEK